MNPHDEDVTLLVGSGTDKKGNSRLRKWLIGVLVCLCASLLIVNSLTYGQFSIYSRFVRSSSSHLQSRYLIFTEKIFSLAESIRHEPFNP